jgi:hypothetical protein
VSAVIADSLYLSFPGELRVTSAHILLQTPFNSDGFLKVYDRKTGREVDWLGNIGGGPEEWITPALGNVAGDRLMIFDLNQQKYVLADAGTMYREISDAGAMKKTDFRRPLGMVFADDGLLVVADYAETPFKLLTDGKILPCGKYPFAETVANTRDRFQGSLAVHPEKQILAYGMIENPYLALYRIKPDGLEPVWEKQFGEADYSVSEGQLRWGDRQPGATELTFTRDYIACLTKEAKNSENTAALSVRGREMKIPLQSIYLFDYDGNLRYQLEPDTHIIRLASDTDSNLLYAVSIHPDFRIVTFDPDRVLKK